MESFGTIAELSENAKKSAGTPDNEVLYSCSEVPALGIKNRLKIFKNRNCCRNLWKALELLQHY